MVAHAAEEDRWSVRAFAMTARLDILIVAVASLLLLAFTLPNLANHPVPSDDEIWILSASHKLATEGVFGTDLFTGFYRAEEVYLFNMPAHHFVLAAAFKVFGTSIFVGRMVSVLYGVAALALVYVIGLRLGGRGVASVALGLMLLLRLNIGFDTGLPLQEMARSIRYDLAPVPFTLAALVALLKPTLPRIALAGALLSIATLLQFYAAFMFPVAAAYLLLEPGREWLPKLKQMAIMGLVAAAVASPYAVFVAANYYEFKGQTSTLERRIHFSDPDFYITNLKRERDRFPLYFDGIETALTERPSAKIAILFGLPAAVVFSGWRAYRSGDRAHRLLALSLLGVPLQFAVLDSQKIYFYWIAVLPFLSLGLAALAVWAFQGVRGWRPPARLSIAPLSRLAVGAAAAGFLAIVSVEGVYAQVQGVRVWNDATEYLSLREKLDDYVPEDSRVLGATALWWAMPETDYRSYYMLFYRTNPRITDDLTTVSGYLDEFGAEYIVFNRTSRMFLRRLIARDENDLNQYLRSSCTKLAQFDDRSYGFIEVWKVDRTKRPGGN
jgi:4-amino-4-deoxy-L-arabinose transferase-like glycosyltransferase